MSDDLELEKAKAMALAEADGIEFEKEEEVYFCGCKQTKNPPFCDDSHLKLK